MTTKDIKINAIKKTLLQIFAVSIIGGLIYLLYILTPILDVFLSSINPIYIYIFTAIVGLLVLYQFNVSSLTPKKSAWIKRTTETPPDCEFINVEVTGEDKKLKIYFNKETKDIDFSDSAKEPVFSYLPVSRSSRNN